MKKNNKKGFTLIELLAVIVILAILATAAFTLVIPRITESRKNAFVSEIGDIIKAVDLYCIDKDCTQSANQTPTVDTLITNGYLQKQGYDSSKYGGRVKITYDGTKKKFTYKINFRTDSYHTNGCKEVKDIKVDNIAEVTSTTSAPSSLTCS